MVNVQEVTVQVQVGVRAGLDGGVGGGGRISARRERELGEDGEGGEVDEGEALRGEGGLVDDDLEAVRVGGLDPGRLEGLHFWLLVIWKEGNEGRRACCGLGIDFLLLLQWLEGLG